MNRHGEVFVTGSSEGPGTGLDYATVKYDPDGNEVWVARYGAFADSLDEAVSVAEDDFGYAFVTGTAGGFWPDNDILTICYDSRGHKVWEDRYDGPAGGNDSAAALALTSFGDVVVTGWSEGADAGQDFVTVCYDPLLEWSDGRPVTMGLPKGNTLSHRLQRTPPGNVVVTGSSQGIETGSDYATIKYDTDGNEAWTARFENPGEGELRGAQGHGPGPMGEHLRDRRDHVSILPPTQSLGRLPDRQVRSGWNKLWAAKYEGPDALDYPVDLAVDTEGNIHNGIQSRTGTEEAT